MRDGNSADKKVLINQVIYGIYYIHWHKFVMRIYKKDPLNRCL